MMRRLLILLALSGPAAAGSLRAPLGAGHPFIVDQDPRLPRETALLSFEVGAEVLPPPQAAVGPVLGQWAVRWAIQDSNRLQWDQAQRGLSLDGRRLMVWVQAPPEGLAGQLKLAVERLRKPFYPVEMDFVRDKRQAGWTLQGSVQDPRQTFFTLAGWDAFQGNPTMSNLLPGPAGVGRLTWADAQAAVGTLLDPTHLVLAACGPMDVSAVAAALADGLGDWLDAAYAEPAWPECAAAPYAPRGVAVKVLPRPSAEEARVRWIVPHDFGGGAPGLAAEAAAAEILGGSFTGLLWRELRGRQGWCYDVGVEPYEHAWVLRMQCAQKDLGKVLAAARAQLAAAADGGWGTAELDVVRRRLLARSGRDMALTQAALWRRLDGWTWHRDPDFRSDYERALEGLTVETVRKVMRAFSLEDSRLYVSGDPENFSAQWKAAGLAAEGVGRLDLKDW